jgi:hypothetical protein
VSSNDLIAVLLLATHGLALGIGLMILGWVLAMRRRQTRQSQAMPPLKNIFSRSPRPPRPASWLALRSVSPEAVQNALGLHRIEPCSWTDGLAGGHEFFISPRVNGWVIVTGVGLPNPTEDVDATFHFLTALSRQLGHVQYFYASRRRCHHAWARLDDGCVTRAYAWAGETVWNQGGETIPEIEVGMKLFSYADDSATLQEVETNFAKVPQLAARWSLDPAAVRMNAFHQSIGIAGESAFG